MTKRRIDEVHDGGYSRVIAEHYNKIEDSGLEQRSESKIICMRSFNNWIKSLIVNEFVDLARENCHANPTNIKVLDVGCGKGGDLKKYIATDIQHLVCTDIASTTLEQCQERYKKFKEEQARRNKQIYTCEFFPADATRDTIRDKLKNPNMLFDLAVIQFAYHYSFETIEQATKMLENASRNLREGGFFVGSTVNANKVIARTLAAKRLKFGNEIFSIEFPEKALEYEQVPLFGNTYQFRLHDVVDCPEFLVHFPTVVQIAKRFNLELHYQKRFEDYYLENIDEQEKRQLLQRMNALKVFPLNDKTEMNDEQIAYEYAKAAAYQRNNPQLDINERKRIGTISRSEWEACCLYMVFAFKKVTPKKSG